MRLDHTRHEADGAKALPLMPSVRRTTQVQAADLKRAQEGIAGDRQTKGGNRDRHEGNDFGCHKDNAHVPEGSGLGPAEPSAPESPPLCDNAAAAATPNPIHNHLFFQID